MKNLIHWVLRNKKEQLREIAVVLAAALLFMLFLLYEPVAIFASVLGVIVAVVSFSRL